MHQYLTFKAVLLRTRWNILIRFSTEMTLIDLFLFHELGFFLGNWSIEISLGNSNFARKKRYYNVCFRADKKENWILVKSITCLLVSINMFA